LIRDERCADVNACVLALIAQFAGLTAYVIDRADLVTEVLEVKHYYHQGVLARTGIEK